MNLIKSLKIAWLEGRSRVLTNEPFRFKKVAKEKKEEYVKKKNK